MNVHAVAVQVFVGGEHETQSVAEHDPLVDAGYRLRHSRARGDRGRARS